MADSPKYEPPQSNTGDSAHSLATAILSMIPGATELFEYFVKPPLEKRREAWMKMVAETLRDLENSRFDIQKLQTDERFITIIVQATNIAIRNHQHEKLIALRNAIFNSAAHPDFNEDVQLLFIRYIDELTPSHIRLLNFLASGGIYLEGIKSYTQFYELLMVTYPDVMPRDEFKMLVQDLSARSLIRISADIEDFEDIYHGNKLLLESTNDKLPRIVITDVAKQFLDFVARESKSAA